MNQDAPSPSHPSPVVTFLMTDIEGSTRLWEEHRQAMAAALEAHDAVLRRAVADHGGSLFKTTGDGVLAAFAQPETAIACALSAQRSLVQAAWGVTCPLRVRMAVHTGAAQSREGDYFGPAVNRVARLLAIGHGSQVLVSGAAATAVHGALDAGAELLDRGLHRLRDLEQSEHVFQLVAPDLPHDFPPLRSLAPGATNLPSQLTSFVGRARELADLRTLASQHRLVTLIGTGGTGKTRLMLQLGADLADRHPDGVWLVELAAITDPELVVGEVARTLRLGSEPSRATIDTLTDFLRSKSLLLLLDNCEHVIAAAAALVAHLLASCPTLAIVATSREALGIGGEVVFQVPSLALPDPAALPDEHGSPASIAWLEGVKASEAVQLFLDRAVAASPAFAMSPASARAIVEICARLDGIPLAIELAAARVTVLSPEEIAQRLGDRFRLLTGGRRGALPRQQTLQALVDWSWDLLSQPDRTLLARLSVFAGCTLDAAVAVTADPRGADERRERPDTSLQTLDGLSRLVDRSLVIVERGDATRYRMLETIRQYARDRLIASGEAVAIREAHLAFFLELAIAAEKGLQGPDMIRWLAKIDADIDNIRSALEWAFEARGEDALRLGIALTSYWRPRAFGSEAVELVARAAAVALSLPPGEGEGARPRLILVSRALAAAALAHAVWADAKGALPWAEQALELARAADDGQALNDALGALILVRVFSGHRLALSDLDDDVVRAAEQREDWHTVAMTESGFAFGQASMGDVAGAETRLRHATDAAERSGNPYAIAFVALSRGRLSGIAHRLDEARDAFATAVEQYRRLGDRRFDLVARSDLAHVLRREGVLDEAEAMYLETIAEWQHLGRLGPIANQVESFAFLALARGRPLRAARLLGAAERIREDGGAQMMMSERAEYEPAVDAVRRLVPENFESEWHEGRLLTVDEAVALARSTRFDT